MPRRERVGAVLALWNDVDPALADDYEHWHRHEHVPERCTVPGLHWGLRWVRADAGPGPRFFTLYGLRDAQVLDEPAYQRLLKEPTPASQRMRPALRNLQRWVCAMPAAPRAPADRGADAMAAGDSAAEWAQAVLAMLHTSDRLCVWTAHTATAKATTTAPIEIGSNPEVLWLARQADVQALPWLTGVQEAAGARQANAAAHQAPAPLAWLGLATDAHRVPSCAPPSVWRRLPVGEA